MKVQLPYGRTHIIAEIPDNRIQAVLRSRLESYIPPADEAQLVRAALQKPIGSRPLEEIAVGKEKEVLISTSVLVTSAWVVSLVLLRMNSTTLLGA